MSLSSTHSKLSHHESLVISDGAIARIKYKTNADDDASSIWNGKNASTVVSKTLFWGDVLGGAYPSSHHLPVYGAFVEVFEQTRRSIVKETQQAVLKK